MNISLTAGKKFTLQVHALPFLPLPLATGSSIMYVRPHFPLQGTRMHQITLWQDCSH